MYVSYRRHGVSDPGGSKKAKILKSSNLSKTSTGSKGSLRQFQRYSLHLKLTPYEKVIAFYSIRSTGKIGKKRCHVAPLKGWHMAVRIQAGIWWLDVQMVMWQYRQWLGSLLDADWAWGGPILGRHVAAWDWPIYLRQKLWPPWGLTLWPLLYKYSTFTTWATYLYWYVCEGLFI